MPLVRNNGHLHIVELVRIIYTSSELHKIHLHFYQTHPEKQYSVMERADPSNVSPDAMADLEGISTTYHVRQREAAAAHSFQVFFLDNDCGFNRTVCIDLIKLNSTSVLHTIDNDTKFSAACFLSGDSTKDVLEAFIRRPKSRFFRRTRNISCLLEDSP